VPYLDPDSIASLTSPPIPGPFLLRPSVPAIDISLALCSIFLDETWPEASVHNRFYPGLSLFFVLISLPYGADGSASYSAAAPFYE